MVQVNDTHTFLIGGYNESPLKETWLFNWEKMEWIQQGNLSIARGYHSCGLHRNEKVIVAGGRSPYLNSTEVFDLSNPGLGWIMEPILPEETDDASIINLASHLIHVGGTHMTRKLYEYTGEGWTELKQELKVGRWYHSTVLIPDDLLDC